MVAFASASAQTGLGIVDVADGTKTLIQTGKSLHASEMVYAFALLKRDDAMRRSYVAFMQTARRQYVPDDVSLDRGPQAPVEYLQAGSRKLLIISACRTHACPDAWVEYAYDPSAHQWAAVFAEGTTNWLVGGNLIPASLAVASAGRHRLFPYGPPSPLPLRKTSWADAASIIDKIVGIE